MGLYNNKSVKCLYNNPHYAIIKIFEREKKDDCLYKDKSSFYLLLLFTIFPHSDNFSLLLDEDPV